MTTYRPTTDPTMKHRTCTTCTAPITGITNLGLTTWLDTTPLTPLMETIYHHGQRNTFHVQPRGTSAWIDWRNPTTPTPPSRGIILVQHPHQTPSTTRTPPPDWATPPPTTNPHQDTPW